LQMEIYAVGGAIRDELLGLSVTDRDYVVVGATAEEMVAQGFLPVGRDFPVFLHPVTHEEYALARTERKSGRGYQGFVVYASPEVSLEQDLARRDFTVNAMARATNGALIDPYGGQVDLLARVFRHVGAAFVEDPVRILRAARFMARFPDFIVAPETMHLMRQMVADGEVDELVPERVWQELARGLMAEKPSRMFDVLRDCGALKRLLPEIDALFGVPQSAEHHPEIDAGLHTLMALDYSASQDDELAIRFAVLLHDVGKAQTPDSCWPHHPQHEQAGVVLVKQLCTRLRVPGDCRDLAVLATAYHGEIHRVSRAGEPQPEALVHLFEMVDAFRRPQRFESLLKVCVADARGRVGHVRCAYPQADFLRAALDCVRSVDAGAIAARVEPARIAVSIHEARVRKLEQAMLNNGFEQCHLTVSSASCLPC
jgi:tRNA nucleotidyltransferase (CCA-adding enzyme)